MSARTSEVLVVVIVALFIAFMVWLCWSIEHPQGAAPPRRVVCTDDRGVMLDRVCPAGGTLSTSITITKSRVWCRDGHSSLFDAEVSGTCTVTEEAHE